MSGSAVSRAANRFEADYAALSEDAPGLGQIALLPWDGDIFGFRVADYRPGSAGEMIADAGRLTASIELWSERETVDLVGCRVPARPAALGALLESVGFRFIEIQLRATVPRLASANLRAARITVRSAEAADHAGIARIAGSAFTLGRYHADPRFPRLLADRRYRVWMERALSEPSPGAWIGVVGPPAAPTGFLQAEIAGSLADIRLAAVDRRVVGIAGPELFRGSLHEFAGRGVTQVTARISAVNSSVLNIYASLGFHFHEPELVFHWHRPAARGLQTLARSLDDLDGIDGQERSR